jgi:hypothetical protein
LTYSFASRMAGLQVKNDNVKKFENNILVKNPA